MSLYTTGIDAMVSAFAVPESTALQCEARFLEALGVPRWQQALNFGLPRRTVTIGNIVDAGPLLGESEKRFDPLASVFTGAGGKSYGFIITSDSHYYNIVRRD